MPPHSPGPGKLGKPPYGGSAARKGAASEMVDHPAHYNQGKIECIEALESALTREEYIGFLKGTQMVYLWRLGHKDAPAQEAGKSNWYGRRLQDFLERKDA